jgi:hypothetical protein
MNVAANLPRKTDETLISFHPMIWCSSVNFQRLCGNVIGDSWVGGGEGGCLVLLLQRMCSGGGDRLRSPIEYGGSHCSRGKGKGRVVNRYLGKELYGT